MRLKIETNSTNDKGTIELMEVEQNGELDTISMREIEQWSTMSEKSSVMTSPLVNHLHFNGMAEYGKNILLGKATYIMHIDIYTKRYFQEIAAITRSLPDKKQPIYLEEYTKEVGCIREGTSSGPSDATSSMVKTEVLDPELAEIG